MSKKIKVGIIGVGSISELHIEGYKKNPNVELYAFCDINEKTLKMRAEKYGIEHVFTNADDMLALPEIDAVSVCTWNSEHAPCTIKALNAGKHVLCEKPMSINAELAAEMKKAAEKNNKLLQIGFVRRFGNDARVMKDLVNDDFFGDIYYAKAQYLRRKGAPGGWFGEKARSGGGPLIDLGVHVIDLVRYLAGNPNPISVYGITSNKLKDRRNVKSLAGYSSTGKSDKDVFDVEDLASAMIKFDNGMTLLVETSFSLNIKENVGKIEFFGTKGGAKFDPELQAYSEQSGYMTNVDFAYPTALSFDGLFDNEINHFVDCVVNGTTCMAPAEDGVQLMKILDAVYESAKTGHEVILK